MLIKLYDGNSHISLARLCDTVASSYVEHLIEHRVLVVRPRSVRVQKICILDHDKLTYWRIAALLLAEDD